MTPDEAAAYRRKLHENGIQLGLDRMARAMELCQNPHRRLRVIHVAGTNGKGSTARMIQAMCTAAGYRTGLYTSPVVTDLCDTITIDGVPITKERLAELTAVWQERQDEMGECGPLSEFELVTALTLEYFAEQRVDLCVLECGMGGRGDATNICPAPLAAVLTPIACDHTAFLGNTVEEITAEKCGIMKPPCRVVVSPAMSEEALAVIYEHAAAEGLTVRQPVRAAAEDVRCGVGETRFTYDGERYEIPLGGTFQVDNALTALEVVTALSECGFAVDAAARRAGLLTAALPCREEVISRTPLVILDGAHNPHGITALVETIKQNDLPPLTLLVGMLQDKDTAACAALLAPIADRVICTTPLSERALAAEHLAAQFRAAGAQTVAAEEDIARAFLMAKEAAGDGPLLVAGSFYTASAVRAQFF